MSESKQAILPLWGRGINARAVHVAAVCDFKDLCDEFVDADAARDEARMEEVIAAMHKLVRTIGRFKHRQCVKWAKEKGHFVSEEGKTE